ncbi:LacI family DNA-binding transcriptional regulator [Hyphococcus aureus]|uniref:LacI family DNA-binding transcriptional regulator n=2 Tax=Hyphococcus aureus TaxID=2666033 RepID=A0ABW1KYV4_9PROT
MGKSTRSHSQTRRGAPESISIEAVARKAKVSTATVSIVLNGKGERYRISKATQERIKDVAKKLNYEPNPVARSLRLGRTQTIGFVIADLANPFFAELATTLERLCHEHGYLLQISASGDDVAMEEEIIRNFVAKSVDGLIIATSHEESDFLSDIASRTPTVFVDRKIKGSNCCWVTSDNYESAKEAIRRLIDKREFREVAYIGGAPSLSSNIERLQAYENVLEEAGVPVARRIVKEGAFTCDAGKAAMSDIIEEIGRPPDAVFTASYTLLEGALAELKRRYGAAQPDIAIATYDDHPLLDYVAPPILSVRQDCPLLAESAFSILTSMMSGSSGLQRIIAPARIIQR